MLILHSCKYILYKYNGNYFCHNHVNFEFIYIVNSKLFYIFVGALTIPECRTYELPGLSEGLYKRGNYRKSRECGRIGLYTYLPACSQSSYLCDDHLHILGRCRGFILVLLHTGYIQLKTFTIGSLSHFFKHYFLIIFQKSFLFL
jgi:hypothetical protein